MIRLDDPRFLKGGGCWFWAGNVARRSAPAIRIKGRAVPVSHLALLAAGKERLSGDCALHSCDNRHCVNPAHLRWGTPKENGQDRAKRGPAKSQHRQAVKEVDRLLKMGPMPSEIDLREVGKCVDALLSKIDAIRKPRSVA